MALASAETDYWAAWAKGATQDNKDTYIKNNINRYLPSGCVANLNGDGTGSFHYKGNKFVLKGGEISIGLDFDEVKADVLTNKNAYLEKASSKGQATSTNKDIGIGTDGNVVNLDLWNYKILNESNGTIQIGSFPDSGTEDFYDGSMGTAGYIGNLTSEGSIQGMVPQYIYMANKDKFYTVVDLSGGFAGLEALKIAPEIPETVMKMAGTFADCRNLTVAPEIPEGVTSLKFAFKATALEVAPKIPDSVTSITLAFYSTNITEVPAIPSGMIYMAGAFCACRNLTSVNVTIPNSVEKMEETFSLCPKLSGEITINANPATYNSCFIGTSTDANASLTVKGSSTVLEQIKATKSDDSHIN